MPFFFDFLQRTLHAWILFIERPAGMRGQIDEWIDTYIQSTGCDPNIKHRFLFRHDFPDSPESGSFSQTGRSSGSFSQKNRLSTSKIELTPREASEKCRNQQEYHRTAARVRPVSERTVPLFRGVFPPPPSVRTIMKVPAL